MEYISSQEAADKWGVSKRRVQVYCEDGRIKGVFKLGKSWAIPNLSDKPKDARIKGIKKNKGKV